MCDVSLVPRVVGLTGIILAEGSDPLNSHSLFRFFLLFLAQEIVAREAFESCYTHCGNRYYKLPLPFRHQTFQ